MDEQNDENVDTIGLSCALEMFSEVNEVLQMIHNLKTIYNDSKLVEKAYDRFVYILYQYFEQPHLLDPHLDTILSLLIDMIRNPENPIELKHETFKYMFVFVKVRGYKIVVRHLPHEVSDFEPVLKFLEGLNPNDAEIWRSRYVLLIWMSIIIMIPFHMSRLDGYDAHAQDASGQEKKTVMARVLDICKKYVVALDACRDAAVLLTSRFLSRSDVRQIFLEPFFEWAFDTAKNSKCLFARYGAMSSIARILKQSERETILPYAPKLLKWIQSTNFQKNEDRNISKFGYKIIQRIGLVFLKPRIANWRYKRGNRSLAENLKSAGDSGQMVVHKMEESDKSEDEDDNIEVPDELEEIIDELMHGLRNSHGVVRWSAAKGIGRVTGRLPRDLADEVVGSVLELFNPREGDGAWHGGCLALAELGRRGLLLPSRLPEVVPVVLEALNYDVIKGYTSVGSHIRDAACYVCWAFARAYSKDDIAPFVPKIASGLLIVCCFDREINCRRAASAAFQENVGRQGTFPHGIEILTEADFFTVGVRSNSYLQISVFIAQFPEYTKSLIDHLVHRKVDHWDIAIRELTAKALHNLTPKAPRYMAGDVLPKLVEHTKSIDLNARHGGVIAVGEVIFALSKWIEKENIKDISELIGNEMLRNIVDIVPRFRERLYFRGLGGELMKQACADYIEKCSYAHLPLHGETIIDEWFNMLDDCLSHEVLSVRTKAVSALPALYNEYFKIEICINTQPSISDIVTKYIEKLKAETEVIRMGYALALGILPSFMLQNHMATVIKGLIECSKIQANTLKWAQSRRDAIKALTQICRSVNYDFYSDFIEDIYECLFTGLNDYTQDTRGDIGAWVREASMSGLQVVTVILGDTHYLKEHIVSKTMSGIAKQAVERIDRTRALAGSIFSSLLHHKREIPHIPHRQAVIDIFPENVCKDMNWTSESDTFPLFVKLLALDIYTYDVLFGLIVSVGGLTEALVKHSSAALFNFLKSIDESIKPKELTRICDTIVKIFTSNQFNDRVTVPMFGFLDRLLNSGTISIVLDDPNSKFALDIFNLLRNETIECKGTYKLIDSINVLCQLIQVKNEVCNKALVRLSILLCNRHKYIRKTTASRMYEALIVYGDSTIIPLETLDDAMTLLSDTDWEDDVQNLRPIRNNLCQLLGVKPPTLKPATTGQI